MNTITLVTTAGADQNVTGTGMTNSATLTNAAGTWSSDDVGLTVTHASIPANTQAMSVSASGATLLLTQAATGGTLTNQTVVMKVRGPIDSTGAKDSTRGINNWIAATLLDNSVITAALGTLFRVDGVIALDHRSDLTWEGSGTGTNNKTAAGAATGAQFFQATNGNNAYTPAVFTGNMPSQRTTFMLQEGRGFKAQNLQVLGAGPNLTFEDGAVTNATTSLATAGNSRTDTCTFASGTATIGDVSVVATDQFTFRSAVGTGIPVAFTRTDAASVFTSGSATVTDAAITTADGAVGAYRLAVGPGIPINTFVGVGTVVNGVSYKLSSSPTAQVDVLATATSPSFTVTAATAANPSVLTIGAAHGIVTGQSVIITAATGAPALNGTWVVSATGGSTVTVGANGTGYTPSSATLVGAFAVNLSTNGYVGTTTVPTSFKLSCVGGSQINMLTSGVSGGTYTISNTVPPWAALPANNSILNPFFAAGTTISSVSTDGHTIILSANATCAAGGATALTGLQCVIMALMGNGQNYVGYSSATYKASVQGQHAINSLGHQDGSVTNCRMANTASDIITLNTWSTASALNRPSLRWYIANNGLTGSTAGGAIGIFSAAHIDVFANYMWQASAYHIDLEPNFANGGNWDINILGNSFGAKSAASPTISCAGNQLLNSIVRIYGNDSVNTPDGNQPFTVYHQATSPTTVIRSDVQISNNTDGSKSNDPYAITLGGIDIVTVSGNTLHCNTTALSKTSVTGNGVTGIRVAADGTYQAFITTAGGFSFQRSWVGATITDDGGKITAGTQILDVDPLGLWGTLSQAATVTVSGIHFTITYTPSGFGITGGQVTNLRHDQSNTYTPS